MKHNPRVLVVATSRKTRGGITSVVKAHEMGEQWKKISLPMDTDTPRWTGMEKSVVSCYCTY